MAEQESTNIRACFRCRFVDGCVLPEVTGIDLSTVLFNPFKQGIRARSDDQRRYLNEKFGHFVIYRNKSTDMMRQMNDASSTHVHMKRRCVVVPKQNQPSCIEGRERWHTDLDLLTKPPLSLHSTSAPCSSKIRIIVNRL